MSDLEGWSEEMQSAHLYHVLARIEAGTLRERLFAALAREAVKQAAIWADRARRSGTKVPDVRTPPARVRLGAWLVAQIGAEGMHSGSAEATARKLEWVRTAAGSRWEELEIEIGAYFTFVGDAVAGIAEQMAKGLGLSTEDMLAHPHALFGSVDGICEELQRRRERFGISYVTVGAEAIEAFAPVVARLDGQ